LMLLVPLRVLFIRHLHVLQSCEGFGLTMPLAHQDNHKRRLRFRVPTDQFYAKDWNIR